MISYICLLSLVMFIITFVCDIVTSMIIIYNTVFFTKMYTACDLSMISLCLMINMTIIFISILIQLLLWAAVCFIVEVRFASFTDAILYAADAFSTLGAITAPDSNWAGLASFIAFNGIISFSLLTSCLISSTTKLLKHIDKKFII